MINFKKLFLGLALSLLSVSAFAKGININSASAEEIASSVKGIGKVRAEAILEYRTANGPFKSVNDLTKVNGIGKATVQKNKGQFVVK